MDKDIDAFRTISEAAEELATEMLVGMADIQRDSIRATQRQSDPYHPTKAMRIPSWLVSEAA